MDQRQRKRSSGSSTPSKITVDGEFTKLIAEFNSDDDYAAERSAISLSSYGELVTTLLEELLESEDEDQRWWAIRTFSLLDNPPVNLFIKMLSDKSVEVRKCATLAIKQHPTVLALDKLLELLSGKDPLLIKLAADALISIGTPAIPGILRLIEDMEGLGRIEAYRAMAKIGDTRAISVLFNGLNDNSNLISFWSEEGLTNLGMNMVYFQTM